MCSLAVRPRCSAACRRRIWISGTEWAYHKGQAFFMLDGYGCGEIPRLRGDAPRSGGMGILPMPTGGTDLLKNPIPNQGATDKLPPWRAKSRTRHGGSLSVSFSHNPKKDTDKEDRAKKPLSLPCPWHPCNQAVVLIDRGFSTSPGRPCHPAAVAMLPKNMSAPPHQSPPHPFSVFNGRSVFNPRCIHVVSFFANGLSLG
jgi:hypothetical protein